MKCTIFKNIYDKQAFHIPIDKALERIKKGASKATITEIRSYLDKERQDSLKRGLPSVCFSGEFNERKDELLIKHSGFIILDFDNIFDAESRKKQLCESEYAYACWISPRNNGVKMLVKIADGKQHRQHFEALCEMFTDADKSGSNESRVCYESYDPEIYINKSAKVFTKVKVVEKVEVKQTLANEAQIFDKIVTWLTNKGDAFVTGERNIFIFKLASACCRFGLEEEVTYGFIQNNFDIGANKFSEHECATTIKSAYKSNKNLFGSAQFDKDVLVDKTLRKEIEITQEMVDLNVKPKDVIFGEDVKEGALDIYRNGYKAVKGVGVTDLDAIFKFNSGEITLLSGYGNYGKSSFWSWKLLMRILMYGEKYAFFTPEEMDVDFYHNLTETLLGCDCTPDNPNQPSQDAYENAYDFISKYLFYVYPKDLSPTPQYIKERFLELIIKEKVKGVVIDPFNQLANDYGSAGGRTDKYLETFLSDCARFSKQNNLFFSIVAHPKGGAKKDAHGNYPCPDVFDIADGAMWNNKMDNILIYNRPNHQVDPSSDLCELHSKKIRRQKIVGRKGTVTFNFNRRTRRFIFSGTDYMQKAIENSEFYKPKFNVFDPSRVVQTEFKITPNYGYDNSKIIAPDLGEVDDQEPPF
jgi:hypothetical protein